MWIETADDAPERTFDVLAFGTGWDLPTDIMREMQYVGTAQDAAGLVWHYYIMESKKERSRSDGGGEDER